MFTSRTAFGSNVIAVGCSKLETATGLGSTSAPPAKDGNVNFGAIGIGMVTSTGTDSGGALALLDAAVPRVSSRVS